MPNPRAIEMSTDQLLRLLDVRKVYRTGELTSQGVASRTILRALDKGLVERPVLDAALGPVPGVICAASASASPDRDACIALVLTGGVLSGQYAAMLHGLSTSLEARIGVTVLKGTSAPPPQANVSMRVTRLPKYLQLGVEERPTDLGVPLRLTGEARTVADLLRARTSNPDDYRHGLAALATFLERGGLVSDVVEMASHFGKPVATAVEAACAAADESLQRSFGA